MASRRKFKCPQCPKSLLTASYLERHIKVRHKVRIFICDFDGKNFKTKDLLRIHMERHNFSNILTCSVCLKVFTSRHIIRKHLKSHMDKFDCNYCDASYNHKVLLTNHMSAKHGNNSETFKCLYCTRVFASKSSRSSHQIVAHKNKTDELIFHCLKCKISFETKEDLRIHSFIHFNGSIKTCHICEQIFKTERLLKVHLLKHESEKQFECSDCGQKFTFSTGLRKHQRLNRCKGGPLPAEDEKNENAEIAFKQLLEISSKEFRKKMEKKVKKKKVQKEVVQVIERPKKAGRRHEIYTCDFCGEQIKYRKRIEIHMRERHLHRKYSCSHCNEFFKSKKNFHDHSLNIHGIKTRYAKEVFSCSECPLKFDVKSIFEAHQASHYDVRNEICADCGAGFKSVSNLRRHAKSVHAQSRDEVCHDCGKSFKTETALRIHQKNVHADMKVYVNCFYCNSIILEKNLKSHLFHVHSEEGKVKNFTCKICEKAFRNETLLRRHTEAVHELSDRGITYKCNQENCDYESTRLRELKDHELSVHFEGVIHVCDCGKRFKNRKLLLLHLNSHNPAIKHFCNHCDAAFKTRSGLRKHVVKNHQNATEELVSVIKIDSVT